MLSSPVPRRVSRYQNHAPDGSTTFQRAWPDVVSCPHGLGHREPGLLAVAFRKGSSERACVVGRKDGCGWVDDEMLEDPVVFVADMGHDQPRFRGKYTALPRIVAREVNPYNLTSLLL